MPSGPTATSTNDAVPSAFGVTLTGFEYVTPWSVDRENSTALFVPTQPGYCDHAT